MVYVLLPFMVLIIYTSIKNIDSNLIAASKNLGAGPLETFWKVTLPLSKNGVISGSVLVFILGIGSYILPKMLGKPSHWTLPVFIGDQVNLESNVPFAAAMSVILVLTVLLLLWLTTRLSDVDAASLGGA
jgi:ABC-type spermidine/putrescine transport system permease subunit I